MGEKVRLPDGLVLIGAGGAGKEIVFKTLEQEWFVNHYLESGKTLDVYVIDTATGELDGDRKRTQKIEEEIKRIRGESRGVGNVSIRVICLTGEEVTVFKPSDLTREPVRNAVKRQYADIWWLEDPEKDIHFDVLKEIDANIEEDFRGGTHRRRAISKAVLYKAISERDIFDFLKVVNRNVAIIVGLGGGTGSGMFFDIAERIKSQALDVTLFAILPTISEHPPEKFNAYNALSELEYARLNNLLPFNYTILSSLQPTKYDGTTITRDVEQFDQVFAYLLASFYHARAHDAHIEDTMGKYSSFIMGSGCIIKYDVERLLRLKRKVEEGINKLEEVIRSEEELKNLIRGFDWDGEGEATRDDRDDLMSNFKDIKLWEKSVFGYLDYSSITELKKDIEFAKEKRSEPSESRTFEDLMKYIAWMKNEALKERECKDTVDERIHSILPRALSVLCDLGKNIKLVSGLEMDDEVKEVLMKIVKAQSTASEISDLEKTLEDFEEEYRNLLDELTTAGKKLEDVEKLPSIAMRWTEEKCANIQETLKELSQMKRRMKEIGSRSRELRDKIEEKVSNASSSQIESPLEENEWLNRLNLGEIGDLISTIEMREGELTGLREFITDAAMFHYHYKMKEYFEKKEPTPLRRLLNWILGGVSYEEERNDHALEADRRKSEAISRAGRWNIHIDRDSFLVNIPEDFFSRRLGSEISTGIENVIAFMERELDRSAINEVRNILDKEDSDIEMRSKISDILKEFYLKKENYEEEKRRLNDEINKIKEDVKEKERNKRRVERIKELNDGSVSIRRRINDQKNAFRESMSKIDSFLSGGWISESVGKYILDTEKPDPRVLSGVSEHSSMKDVLERAPEEVEMVETKKILYKVGESMDNILLTKGYLGMAEVFKVYGAERWNVGLGLFFVASTSDKILQAVMGQHEMVSGRIIRGLSLSKQQDAGSYIHDSAGAWDTALTLLAASTFADNISSLVGGGGYREAFEALGNKMLYLHHSLLLEQGRYVVRKEFFGLEEAAKMADKESDEDIQRLRGNYEVKEVSEELRKVTLKTEQEQNKQNAVEVRKELGNAEE